MKKLQIAPYVSTTVGFPFKEGTIDFLQQAFQEAIAAEIISRIGPGYDATKAYILYGCEANDLGAGVWSVNAGAVFFNGEYYNSPLQFITGTSLPNIIANVGITQYTVNADPVTFTDGSIHSVHNIRQVLYSNGTPGSGNIDDLQNFITLNNTNWTFTAGTSFGSPESVVITGNSIKYFSISPSGTTNVHVSGTSVLGGTARLLFATSSGSVAFNITGTSSEIVVIGGSPTYSGSGATYHTIDITYIGTVTGTHFYTVLYGAD